MGRPLERVSPIVGAGWDHDARPQRNELEFLDQVEQAPRPTTAFVNTSEPRRSSSAAVEPTKAP